MDAERRQTPRENGENPVGNLPIASHMPDFPLIGPGILQT